MKLLLVMFSVLLLFGCSGSTPKETNTQSPSAETTKPAEITKPAETTQPTPTPSPSPTGTSGTISIGETITVTQEDCATLTPTCDSCLMKKGCGWCKSSNSCLLGSSTGPSKGNCEIKDWAYSASACSVTADGSSCGSKTNCASCLSGTGCKWCIQGAKCVPNDSSETCFGGWQNLSYQCNYATR